MAHHGNTPQSVLEAPQQSFVVIHPQNGRNRRDRRHFQPHSEGNPETPPTLRFKPMLLATMEPARKIEHKDPRRNLDGTRKSRGK